MESDVKNIIQFCKNISSELKISTYDVYGSRKENYSASSKNKEAFALTTSTKEQLIIRVWNENNQVGITSTSNLTFDGLKLAFIMALKSATFFDKNVKYEISPLSLNEISHELNNASQEKVFMRNLAQNAIEGETFLLNANSNIKSVPYNKLGNLNYERFYFNSLNALRIENNSVSFCYFYPLAHEENKLPRQMGHFMQSNKLENLNYLECAKIALEKTLNHLNYEQLSTGSYLTIFSPEAFLDLIQSFSNIFNAQNILDNKSLSKPESLNTQIANSLFCVSDCPLHNENISKIHFDEEGNPTSEFIIFENGVLKNFLQTSYTAKIFKTLPTGHTSLGSKLTAQHHFLNIFSSKPQTTPPQLPSEYVYIEEIKALHSGINALQGSFSLPFDGFIIKNGVRVSIESATVAGDILSLLKNILYISPNSKVTSSGICSDVWVNSLSLTGNKPPELK